MHCARLLTCLCFTHFFMHIRSLEHNKTNKICAHHLIHSYVHTSLSTWTPRTYQTYKMHALLRSQLFYRYKHPLHSYHHFASRIKASPCAQSHTKTPKEAVRHIDHRCSVSLLICMQQKCL